MPKHTSCHKWICSQQPVRLGSKINFSQSVSKFGLGNRKKCRWKEWAQPNFLPRSPEIWICGRKKWKKSVWKEREITLVRAHFFPWRAKIRIWGWENVKNIWKVWKANIRFNKFLIHYHQISLAYAMPKRTSCHKRICSRMGPRPFFPKKCWNLDLGMEKMYMGIFQNCVFVTAWHFSWLFTYKYFSLVPGRLVFGSFVENHFTYN